MTSSTHLAWIRRLPGLAAVGVLGATLVITLATTVPADEDRPLVSEKLGWTPVPVELGVPPTGTMSLRARFRQDDPTLVYFPEIRILVATYTTRPSFASGLVRVLGTDCVYEAQQPGLVPNNDFIRFVRNPSCRRMVGRPTGDYELEMVLSRQGRVAIWTFQVPEGEGRPDLIRVTSPAILADRLVLRGRFVEFGTASPQSRVELLSYLWQVSGGRRWLWSLVGAAIVLAALGVYVIPLSPRSHGVLGSIMPGMAGTFCLAWALSLLYAVLVPPLHAPDEPDHFLSFATLIDRPDLAEDTERWARVGHFERIKFDPFERFRPADVGRPDTVAWAYHVRAEDTAGRSVVASLLWRQLGPKIGHLPAPRMLLAVRLANGLIFSVCLMVGTGLVYALSAVPFPQMGGPTLLAIPALPFFAMHVSRTAPLTSAYVLLAACLLVVFLDSPRSSRVGLPLGLSIGLVAAAGRSAWPVGLLVALVLVGRVLIGVRGASDLQSAVRGAATFWGGVLAGLGLVFLVVGDERMEQLWMVSSAGLGVVREVIRDWARLVPGLGVAMIFTGAVAEIGCWKLRRLLSSWGVTRTGTLARVVSATALLLLAAVALTSFVVAMPAADELTRASRPPAAAYVGNVMASMGTAFRVGPPDHLLVTTFWVGFGWLDVFPPVRLVSLLMMLSGLSLGVLLVHLGWRRDARRLLMLLAVGGGSAAALAAFAFFAWSAGYTLHGRYLIGLYLVCLLTAWSPLALMPPATVPGGKRIDPRAVPRMSVLLGFAIAVHAYALWLVLQRYL